MKLFSIELSIVPWQIVNDALAVFTLLTAGEEFVNAWVANSRTRDRKKNEWKNMEAGAKKKKKERSKKRRKRNRCKMEEERIFHGQVTENILSLSLWKIFGIVLF